MANAEQPGSGAPPDENAIEVPFSDLAPETLRNLAEEFVTRDGTDYGDCTDCGDCTNCWGCTDCTDCWALHGTPGTARTAEDCTDC